MRTSAFEQVARLTGPVQMRVLRDWASPEWFRALLARPAWQSAMLEQFLTGAWPDEVEPPALEGEDPSTEAAYRLLCTKSFDAGSLAPRFRRAGPAGQSRMLARLRAMGLGQLARELRSGEWDILVDEARQDSERAWQALQRLPPGWALDLLDVARPPSPQDASWLERLRATRPARLQLDYPHPVRVHRRSWERKLGWLRFVRDDALLVFEQGAREPDPGQLWLWEPPLEPRRLGGAYPVFPQGAVLVSEPARVLAVHSDGWARSWSLPQGLLMWEVRIASLAHARAELSPDGRYVLLILGRLGYRVLHAATGQVLATGKQPCGRGAFSPDSDCVFLDSLVSEARRLPSGERIPFLPETQRWLSAPPADPRLVRVGGRQTELRLGERRMVVGGSVGNTVLGPSLEWVAVRQPRRRLNLYRLRGDGRDAVMNWNWYPRPATDSERFASLFWEFQHRYEVELDDTRPEIDTDIELD